MKKWHRYEELLEKTKLLIFHRGEIETEDESAEIMDVLKLSCGYKFVDLDPEWDNISSTEVRKCYTHGEMNKLKSLVPNNVYKYLEENKNVFF